MFVNLNSCVRSAVGFYSFTKWIIEAAISQLLFLKLLDFVTCFSYGDPICAIYPALVMVFCNASCTNR